MRTSNQMSIVLFLHMLLTYTTVTSMSLPQRFLKTLQSDIAYLNNEHLNVKPLYEESVIEIKTDKSLSKKNQMLKSTVYIPSSTIEVSTTSKILPTIAQTFKTNPRTMLATNLHSKQSKTSTSKIESISKSSSSALVKLKKKKFITAPTPMTLFNIKEDDVTLISPSSKSFTKKNNANEALTRTFLTEGLSNTIKTMHRLKDFSGSETIENHSDSFSDKSIRKNPQATRSAFTARFQQTTKPTLTIKHQDKTRTDFTINGSPTVDKSIANFNTNISLKSTRAALTTRLQQTIIATIIRKFQDKIKASLAFTDSTVSDKPTANTDAISSLIPRSSATTSTSSAPKTTSSTTVVTSRSNIATSSALTTNLQTKSRTRIDTTKNIAIKSVRTPWVITEKPYRILQEVAKSKNQGRNFPSEEEMDDIVIEVDVTKKRKLVVAEVKPKRKHKDIMLVKLSSSISQDGSKTEDRYLILREDEKQIVKKESIRPGRIHGFWG